ncbi:hypothetical protein L7F22_034278 [Adiantum nelumboides]|nr:hypothetical protein [Adiantum nelumboides]
MASKSKVLVIGATGYIGGHIVLYWVLLWPDLQRATPPSRWCDPPPWPPRPPCSTPSKLPASLSFSSPLIKSILQPLRTVPTRTAANSSMAMHIPLQGTLEDHESLVAAIKQVDVVISAIGSNTLDHLKIIEVIKQVGTIKRFFPSEFGNDVDRVHALEPAKTHVFGLKAQIRRAVEESGIPYTFVVSNGFAGYFLSNLLQHGLQAPPRDKVSIYGSGDVNFITVLEEDVGAYTMKAVDDPRTLNKTLHIRPPANIVSMNSLVEMWETLIGKTLEKVTVTEEDMVKQIQGVCGFLAKTPFPGKILPAIFHDIVIQGDQCNFELGPKDVEATTLYPDHKYTTAKEYLARLL